MMTISRDGKIVYRREGPDYTLAQVASVFVIPLFLLLIVAAVISKCG